MKNNILFISDSSLKNPILQSQGLPYLSQLDDKSFNIFFIYFEDQNEKEIDKNLIEEIKKKFSPHINYIEVNTDKEGVYPKWFNFIWRSTKVCKRIVRQNNIHLIHARSFFPALSGVIIKTFFNPRIKVIYDNRGLYIDEHIYNGRIRGSSIKEKIYRKAENLLLKISDSIVVVSNQFRNYLLNYNKFPVLKLSNKIEVIPNRTRLVYNEDEVLKIKLNFDEKISCIYSGSSASWQGTEQFFEILKSLITVFPTIQFNILSYDQNNLPKFSKQQYELQNRITIESVPHEKVFEKLAKANFGILLRPQHILSRVCSPIKFAEYLAAGLPLLLNEGIGDTEDVISKYNIGVIIRNNNFETAAREMKALLLDNKIYARCVKAAKEEFDIEVSFKHYENIYRKLLQ